VFGRLLATFYASQAEVAETSVRQARIFSTFVELMAGLPSVRAYVLNAVNHAHQWAVPVPCQTPCLFVSPSVDHTQTSATRQGDTGQCSSARWPRADRALTTG